MNPYDLIRRPVVSEKNTMLMESGQYTFEVVPQATKQQIKDAVEQVFNVRVVAVNTVNVAPRQKFKRVRTRQGARRVEGRTAGRKKAIVKLAPGQRIEIFEGL
jgi:large subunit ribosomal protein L23